MIGGPFNRTTVLAVPSHEPKNAAFRATRCLPYLPATSLPLQKAYARFWSIPGAHSAYKLGDFI